MENGYHLYTFSGHLLREEPIEQFKQWAWRPRPERLLTKDEMKNVRKNLREYSRQFEEADQAKRSSADKAVVDARRRMLEEWVAWRERVEGEVLEERRELGLGDVSEERKVMVVGGAGGEDGEGDEGQVVEEIFEEILEESEEILG